MERIRHQNLVMSLFWRNWVCFYFIIILVSCGGGAKKKAPPPTPEVYVSNPSGLQYRILQEGTGQPAEEGNEVLIFETTTYRDGTVLYSNENTSSPVKVLIGGHQATNGLMKD
jgi:hypothetical protein